MQPAIITLTRYADIFEQFRSSVDRWEPDAYKVVVKSGGVGIHASGWKQLDGIEPFVYARNANLGFKLLDEQQDVLLSNDDCQLTQPILEICRRIVQDNPSIGIVSPQIDGGVVNVLQHKQPRSDLFYISEEGLAFVCVYISAKARAAVGDLDERFIGYGWDDGDYSVRVQQAGFLLAVTPRVVVRHGFQEHWAGNASFGRYLPYQQKLEAAGMNARLFNEKYRKE